MCRKAHGAAFATFGGAAPEDFGMLRGEGLARRYRSSPRGARYFCPRCGSIVPSVTPGKPVAIPLGNIAEDPIARVRRRTSSSARRRRGTTSPTTCRSSRNIRPSFGFDTSTTRRPPRSAPTPGATGGSCLCGAVSFEYRRPAACDGELPLPRLPTGRERDVRHHRHRASNGVPLAFRGTRHRPLCPPVPVMPARRSVGSAARRSRDWRTRTGWTFQPAASTATQASARRRTSASDETASTNLPCNQVQP